MSNIYKNFSDLVGNTPVVELNNIRRAFDVKSTILAKLEYLNPAGSAKDRVAKAMIEDAESRGLLSEGAVIVEPTSGNTGIGLAAVAASKGYKVILTMPDTMSAERRALLKAYGAELVLTDGAKGMAGAIEKADQIAAETPGSILAGQFVNPANPAAHYNTTGPEILRDTDGKVDIFVAGVGTGGTVTGVGRYLKENIPDIKIVGVEPAGSPYLTKGIRGFHGLQGIGAGFVPDILDLGVLDEIIAVEDENAYSMGRAICQNEGILVGITSGAVLWAALELARRPENQEKTILVLLPDTGDRYLSTPMFE